MSYFTERAKQLGINLPEAGQAQPGETYFQQRARELGASLTPQQSQPQQSDFFTQRQMELGAIPDTRPAPQPITQQMPGLSNTANVMNSSILQQAKNYTPTAVGLSQPSPGFVGPPAPVYNSPAERFPTDYPGGIWNPVNDLNSFRNSTLGNFIDETVQAAGSKMGLSAEQMSPAASTGNKYADSAAQLIGGTAGYFGNPAKVPGLSVTQNFLNNPVVQRAGEAAGRRVQNLLPDAGMTISRDGSRVVDSILGQTVNRTAQGITQAGLGSASYAPFQTLTSGGEFSDIPHQMLEQGLEGAAFGGALGAASPTLGVAFRRMFSKPGELTPSDTFSQAAGSRNALNVNGSNPAAQQAVDRFNFIDQQSNAYGTRPLALPESNIYRRSQGTVLPPNTDPIYGKGEIYTPPVLGLPEGSYVAPQRLRINTPEEAFQSAYQKVLMTPPLENPNELAKWVRDHMNNNGYGVSLNEVRKLGYNDLQQLAAEIKTRLSPLDVVRKTASDMGYGKIFDRNSSLADRIAQDAQNRTYGVYPESLPKVKTPQLNKQVLGQAAAPVQKTGIRRVNAWPAEQSGPPLSTQASRGVEAPIRSNDANIGKTAGPQRLITQLPGRAETPVQTSSPVREPSAALSGGKPVRANYRNLRDNGNFSAEFNKGLQSQDLTYRRITNKETVAKANENVKNLTAAEARFLGNEVMTPEHVATGYRLIQELDRGGHTDRALNIANKLAADLTRGGQSTQAAAVLQRLSPEGRLLDLKRHAERKGKTVSASDAKAYMSLAREVQDATLSGKRTHDFMEILSRLKSGKEVSPAEMKKAASILEEAKRFVKTDKPTGELPKEFKDVRKRDKIISFLDEAEQAALDRISRRKNNLNSMPLGEWTDHAIVVASQMAKGSIKAATYAEDMVKLFGEQIRPYAEELFNRAGAMLDGTAKHISEGKIDRANEAFRKLSGQAQAEKSVVAEMASHVKKVIADAKAGKMNVDDIQKIRDLSDEIAEFPVSQRQTTDEQRFLQSVKSLAKKIAQVETEKVTPSEATKEVASLIRKVSKMTDEGTQIVKSLPNPQLDNTLNNLAADLLEKTRPNPKPVTAVDRVLEHFVKQGGISPQDETLLRDLAKQVNELSGERGVQADMKMQQILNGYQKSNLGAKVATLRYIGMLLNTSTQAVNAISGPMMMTYHHMLDMMATPLDLIYSGITRSARSTTFKQGPGAFDNLFTPVKDWFKGLKVGGKAGWQGVDPEGIATQHDIRGLSFRGRYNPLGLAERTLGAVAKGPDYATFNASRNIEMRKLAYLDAINQGIKGKENIRNHMDQYLANPNTKALEQASRVGKKLTFQNTEGLAGKAANAARSVNALTGSKDLGIANVVSPFVRTPLNIAITGIENSPAGLLKGLFEINRLRRGADDISKREILKTFVSATLGGTVTLGGLGYVLSDLGIITGDYSSSDKDVQALQDSIGKGKFRFNTSAFGRMFDALTSGNVDNLYAVSQYREGDTQIDYNRLQPLAFPVAAGATYQQGAGTPAGARLAAAGKSSLSSLFGMSALQGLQQNFTTKPGSTGAEIPLQIVQNVGENFAKGFSPSGLAQEARRRDPLQRNVSYNGSFVDDVSSYYKSRTPGLSKTLQPKQNNLGDLKQNAPGALGQYVNPLRSEVATYNKAAQIVSDLIDRTGDEKLAPTAMDKTIRGTLKGQKLATSVKLEPARYTQLQQDVGGEIARRILALPPNLDDATKAKRIEDIYNKVKDSARTKLKKELGFKS